MGNGEGELDKNATSWGPTSTDSDAVGLGGAWGCVFLTNVPGGLKAKSGAAPCKAMPSSGALT